MQQAQNAQITDPDVKAQQEVDKALGQDPKNQDPKDATQQNQNANAAAAISSSGVAASQGGFQPIPEQPQQPQSQQQNDSQV